MAKRPVRYLVFDVESVADAKLVAAIRYPGERIKPAKAVKRYRDQLLEKYESDFIPYTFQIPVSVAVAKVAEDFQLIDLVTLDEPQYRPHVITENFWRGWAGYGMPTLVSFNGRGFDMPLLELAAFRYGIEVPDWFNIQDRGYEQRRNRYNTHAHFDLQDLFTNFGATRINGGLNLIANLIGTPGKMQVSGNDVQDLYDQGQLAEINDYCRCDVLDTYFVFLRVSVLTGNLQLEQEQQLVAKAKAWLEKKSDECPIYADYLASWGQWNNPWKDDND